jgi:hypothetical protein
MSSGFSGPIVFGPEVSNKSYPYRRGTGMVPSAEWSVFMDDFYSFVVATAITNGPVANTPWGWQSAIIDSGATVTVNTTAAIGANGILTLADATASEGAAVYGTRTLQLTAGKRFWMEMRVRTDDVADNTIQFGLSVLTATTNPEDLWTTAATDYAALGITDGSAFLTLGADKSNAGPTVDTSTTQALTANTWNVLALSYDGANLLGYLNGQLAVGPYSATAKIPTGVALAPFFGHINGDGGASAVVAVDYIRWASER